MTNKEAIDILIYLDTQFGKGEDKDDIPESREETQ